jgi:hypothetical protein
MRTRSILPLLKEPWLPEWLSFLSGVPEFRRKRTVLVAIQAYVDETEGKGNPPLFVFSGLIAEAQDWARFSDTWNDCLRESPSIRYFKMDEAVGLDGEFYQFSETERNWKLTRLCHVISEFEIREIHCSLDLADFKQIAIRTAKPASDRYFFPFHATILMIAFDLFERNKTEPFEIFFDENRIFGPRARSWYPVIRTMIDDPIRSVMPVEPLFRSDIHTMPLQAADLTAWIVRMTNSQGLGEFAWLEDELQLVPSRNSIKLNAATLHNLGATPVPGLLDKMQEPLAAYRRAFGHDWPPRTKAELKKHRGR